MKRLALLLVAAPLALAACGGSSSSAPKTDPVAYVKQAATKTADLKSEHMNMTATVSAGSSMNLTLGASGDFVNAAQQGTMTMNMGVGGRNLQMKAILDGTTMYAQSPMFSSQLPTGKSWMKIDLKKAGDSSMNFSSLSSQSPTQLLQQLEAAGSVKSLGTESIDGVDTTHYQVTNLDFAKLPHGAKLDALAHPSFGPIDVWIGNSDGYVRRESLSFTYSVAGQSGSMKARVDLSKFGEPVDVTIPPSSEVFDATSLASGGLGQ